MIPHQWLFGSVAFVIGALSLAGAITNHDWFFQLNKLRLLEGALGRRGARWACALFGCGLIVLGGLIVAGYLPRQWASSDAIELRDPVAGSVWSAALPN
jgi:hypothetical protein